MKEDGTRSERIKQKYKNEYKEKDKEVKRQIRRDKQEWEWVENIARQAEEAARSQHMKTQHICKR